MLELEWGWSGHIRVQEMEVMHSHDLICQCDDAGTVVSSKADKATPRVVRDNLVFESSVDVLALGGPVRDRAAYMEAWDEWVGLAERVLESDSERFDMVWCETVLEQPRDKSFEFPISNFNSVLDKDTALSTVLTYTEEDLVPLPIKIAPEVAEQGVEIMVAEGVVRKVRLVNDLVLTTGSEEQRQVLVKSRGKGRRTKIRGISGRLCDNMWVRGAIGSGVWRVILMRRV
ncbi:hypothetical protein V6N13_025603 [Hibiscus sabdariffa]